MKHWGVHEQCEKELAELDHRMGQAQGELRFFREQVARLDLALEAARQAPPGPEFAKLIGPLSQCPTCGAGVAWVSRRCCPLGRLVGRVEGKMVADALMEKGS